MGCAGIGKTAIVSLNSSFLLLSIGLLVIGLLVQYNQDILNDVLGMVTDMLKNSLDSIEQTAGTVLKGKLPTSISSNDIKLMIQELLQNISKPLIIVSACFIAISGSGLVGGCCKSNCFLVLYCIFLVVIILAEAAFLALFLLPGTMIDEYIKTALREGLQFKKYTGIRTENGTMINTIWMAIMNTLDCCGLDSSADFKQTQWWDMRQDNMTVPIACCKNFTGALQEEKPECAFNPWSNTTNIDLGCYKAMKDKIFESQLNVGIFAGVCVVIFLVEAILFFSAIAVVKENVGKKKKVYPASRRSRRH